MCYLHENCKTSLMPTLSGHISLISWVILIKFCTGSVPWKLVILSCSCVHKKSRKQRMTMRRLNVCESGSSSDERSIYQQRAGRAGGCSTALRCVPARALLFIRSSAVVHAARVYRSAAAATVPWVQWLPPDCYPFPSHGTISWTAGGKCNYRDQPYMKFCNWTSVENGDSISSSLD